MIKSDHFTTVYLLHLVYLEHNENITHNVLNQVEDFIFKWNCFSSPSLLGEKLLYWESSHYFLSCCLFGFRETFVFLFKWGHRSLCTPLSMADLQGWVKYWGWLWRQLLVIFLDPICHQVVLRLLSEEWQSVRAVSRFSVERFSHRSHKRWVHTYDANAKILEGC